MPSATLTQAVLLGLLKAGHFAGQVATLLGVTNARLEKLRSGQANLTSDQRATIQKATGKSAGQLAASGVEPRGGKLNEIMDILASTTSKTRTATRRPLKAAV